MTKSVLITGGSGLLGSALTELLLQKGYQVSHLGRKESSGRVKRFCWSASEKYFDPDALNGVSTIIHLAGAGIADNRWTNSRKKEILESRTLTSQLLYESLKSNSNEVKTVISISAIGYYGLMTGSNWCTEEQEPGNDFLASVTKAWEESVKAIETLGKRITMMRTGVVLSNRGGALPEIAKPIKWFVGAPLGNGKQWVSWIHIDDLCRMFLHVLENESISGIYNAVAPNPVTNSELTKFISHELKRPIILPPVPEFVLKIILGEMAQIVVNGARTSCDKIMSTGFQFDFTEASIAVKNLLQSPH